MRKLRACIFSMIAALLLFDSTPPANAVPAARVAAVRIYTVYSHNCFGPGSVVAGEWTRECDGTWIGWGWKPGEYSCSRYDLEYGDLCEFE